tara:strand:+ start:68 stop:631 length:564 start_codon:yes stop_codon:yes gene_type:complete
MNNIKIINKINTLVLLTFLVLFSSVVNADTSYPNTSVAIVDINLILTESNAAKSATKQFEKIQKKTEEDISNADKEMLEERNKLIEQQSVIAPEAFELKAKDYEKKLQNYQNDKQIKLRNLEGVLQKVRNQILDEVKPILEELSKEIGITVILEKNTVLLNANNMDITDKVVKKLNKKLPKVKVSID